MPSTKQERDTAVTLARAVGAAEAARRLDINPNTLRVSVSRAGESMTSEQTKAATKAKIATVAERKAQLAADLLTDAQQLRAQLFAPCVERKAMAAGQMRDVQIVDVHLDQPHFTDQRAIMTSIAIAVDKIQILTGEATERIETLIGGKREQVTSKLDELRARRAS